ncbi:MAG: hypothetical protein HOW73_03045 [Polyangiaceae bacterium]|nr:hypothetical protein [Polyangiaceae bacterium]
MAVAQQPAGSGTAAGTAKAPTATPTATAKATASASAPTTGTAKAAGSVAPGTAAPATAAASAPGGSAAPTATAAGTTTGAGPSTAAPAGSAAPGAAGAPMDGQTYAVRLRDLEQKIDELKEQIRRSHTRLSLLSDTILSGGGSGSRAVVRFKNDLSDAFRITKALFVLDGAVQYNKTDQSGALNDQDEIPIFNGSIPPGDHTLQVLVNLQGNGYGVFSYLRGYKFEVRSSHSFSAVEGKTVTLDAVAYEKGSVTTPLEERPAIRYTEKVVSGLADPNAPADASQQQPAAQQKP